MDNMRERFATTATELLDTDPRLALVLADISTAQFAPAAARHPERVINVGIREQLLISVAGGLALAGLRPIVHTFSSFSSSGPSSRSSWISPTKMSARCWSATAAPTT